MRMISVPAKRMIRKLRTYKSAVQYNGDYSSWQEARKAMFWI